MAINESQAIQSVYDQIFKAYTSPPPGGLPAGVQANKLFLSFIPGGNPVDIRQFANPWSPNNINGSTASTENFSRMVDQIPSVSAVYNPNGSTVSELYGKIVKLAQVIPPAEDSRVKAAREAAQKLLYVDRQDYDDNGSPITVPFADPSPLHRNYLAKKQAYEDAVSVFMSEYQKYEKMTPADQRTWSLIGSSLQRRLTDAWNAYQGAHAKKVEDQLAVMAQSAENQIGQVFTDSQERFEKLRRAGLADPLSSWWASYAFPANWFSSSAADTWPRLTATSRNFQLNESSSFIKYGGHAGFSLGLFSIGGGASHEQEQHHMDSATSNFELSFKYARINIMRPWMDTMVLGLPGWTFPGVGAGYFSSGNVQTAGNTPFTLLPTAFIAVRDVKMSANWGSSDSDFLRKATGAGGSAGGLFSWGLFSIGGSYCSESSSYHFESNFDGTTLTVPGLQIVAWLSTVVPQCPSQG